MKEIIMVDVGHRIYALRKERRLSQEELAEMADISKQTVSLVEGGKREVLASNIAKLAEVLGVSTDYLLFGERTEPDIMRLDRKILSLTDVQYKFLESVINGFVEMCSKPE